MNGDPAAAAGATSDFHLVELHGQWRLTVRRSDRLLAALDATTSAEGLDRGAPFTVHVEPNLLPGGPFEVIVDVTGERTADAVNGRAQAGRRPPQRFAARPVPPANMGTPSP